MNCCTECGSNDISWNYSVENKGSSQDGRIRLHEVDVIFFLGCNYCSETLEVVNGEDIVNKLNILGD